ncbi:hypothetical protein SLS56_003130 [Neofusicoccum ribis]|uniref:Glycoside hydrolase family 28 protein n=1 Tax=Neofusicoccum ribis TaxID=45134 RepID=A0ABR3T0E7_9PEZI
MIAKHLLFYLSRSCVFLFSLLVLSRNNAISNASSPAALDRKECVVQPGGSNATDDAVAIRQAFHECGHGGKVVFLNETYYVNSIMNTTGLEDCDIELHGTLLDIYVNNTSHTSSSARNTDGADTIYASNITFNRWHVVNGDDGISAKANSSDIYVYDTILEDGQGLAMGSIGQFPGWYEYIENFYARNITLINTSYAKTWTGVQQGYPPNGGGGGLGSMEDVTHVRTRGLFQITQCNSYIGATGGCDTSLFHVSDLRWRGHRGSTQATEAAELQCSAAAGGCDGIEIAGIDVVREDDGTVVGGYNCSNVVGPTIGFVCDE